MPNGGSLRHFEFFFYRVVLLRIGLTRIPPSQILAVMVGRPKSVSLSWLHTSEIHQFSLDDLDHSGKICMVQLMLPGGSHTMRMIYHFFLPRLDLYRRYTDSSQHIT